MQVGQQLVIRNSDPLLHNVRADGKINQPFDVGTPIQGMEVKKTFATREVMVPFKCHVHSWMKAYVGVLEHPYFAVTDGSGHFTIPKLPPGTYTIEIWHERFGTQTQQVTVGAKDAKDSDLHLQGVLKVQHVARYDAAGDRPLRPRARRGLRHAHQAAAELARPGDDGGGVLSGRRQRAALAPSDPHDRRHGAGRGRRLGAESVLGA